MSGHLVDTNVISEFSKPIPDSNVVSWLRHQNPATLFISVITMGELRIGVANLPAGKRQTRLEQWLKLEVPHWFGTSLLPITAAIAESWARTTVQAKRNGVAVATTDGLIAATAMVHELTLVTRNVNDFAVLGLPILNPWLL